MPPGGASSSVTRMAPQRWLGTNGCQAVYQTGRELEEHPFLLLHVCVQLCILEGLASSDTRQVCWVLKKLTLRIMLILGA